VPAPGRLAVTLEPAGTLLLVVGLALLWIGLRHHESWISVSGAAALLAVLFSFVLRPRLERVRLVVTGAPRAAVGDELECTVTVTAPAGRSLPACEVRAGAEGLGSAGPPAWLGGAGRGESGQVAVRLWAGRRGVVTGITVALRTSAPFGLVARRLLVTVPHEVAVHPAYRPAQPAEGACSDGEGTAARPDRLGSSVHGLREYRPGDSTRAVAWRATARRGRLVVVEHERQPQEATALLLSGPVHGLTWEEALADAAWTTVAQLDSGAPALLRRLSPTGPVELLAHRREDVLDWFAGVGDLVLAGPDDEADFRRCAAVTLGSGAQRVAVRHLTGTGEWR
jgi:uncharacterized protein (DUF58 family)